jgi:hypothetical protein
MTKIRADEDSPWKLLLRQYFREAIEFFPSIAHLIDWTNVMVLYLQRVTGSSAVRKQGESSVVRVASRPITIPEMP